MTDELEQKLSAARTKLILDKPFLGAITLQLPLIPAAGNWCRTTSTDAKNIYFNPRYIESLNISQTQFILAHDALHCALSHFYRRQHRDKQRWDLACDYAVNQILIDEGLQAPPGALTNDVFKGLTAEEIYPSIETNCEDETLDEHVYDSQAEADTDSKSQTSKEPEIKPEKSQEEKSSSTHSQKPKPLDSHEKEELHQQWQQRLASAAQQAKMANKLSGALQRIIDVSIQSNQSWRQILAQQMSSLAKSDYSYGRPSNRREGPAIFPSLRSQQMNLTVAIDTSGSVKNKELSEFVAEINAIRGQMQSRITLLACDSELDKNSPRVYEPWEDFLLPKSLSGGGSTDFRPAFKWIEHQDIPPDLIIYFTDGLGSFPEQEPTSKIIWLIKGKAEVPWGQRIQLN